jgi:hypothetical protein
MITHPITLLQAINENIEGVQSAPMLVPNNYSSAKMPLALTWESQGETRGQVGSAQTQRNFAIEVMVKPSTVGIVPANFQDTRTLLGRFMDTYLALYNDASDHVLDYGLESGIRVQIDKSKPIVDSGADSAMEVLPEVYYYGFRISIPLIIEWGSELL